jgi:hypothetical protein
MSTLAGFYPRLWGFGPASASYEAVGIGFRIGGVPGDCISMVASKICFTPLVFIAALLKLLNCHSQVSYIALRIVRTYSKVPLFWRKPAIHPVHSLKLSLSTCALRTGRTLFHRLARGLQVE